MRISRLRAHIRSVEVEEILARAGEVAAASEITQSVLEDGELPLGQITDESGQTVRLAQGNLNRFLDSADRRVRQEAWEQSADAYLAFRNTFAATLAGAVKRDVFYARARGYDSSLEAALAGDNIPREVFHNLLDTVWKHLPVWHRYFSVRRRLLGLPEGDLHGYDLEAPLAEQPSFPWERGVETILASARAAGSGVCRRSAPRAGGALDRPLRQSRQGRRRLLLRDLRHRALHLHDLAGQPHQRLHPRARARPLHALAADLAATSR